MPEEPTPGTWAAIISEALLDIGGQGSLDEIYAAAIANRDPSLLANVEKPENSIRRALAEYSREGSTAWKGQIYFRRVGSGDGLWALADADAATPEGPAPGTWAAILLEALGKFEGQATLDEIYAKAIPLRSPDRLLRVAKPENSIRRALAEYSEEGATKWNGPIYFRRIGDGDGLLGIGRPLKIASTLRCALERISFREMG